MKINEIQLNNDEAFTVYFGTCRLDIRPQQRKFKVSVTAKGIVLKTYHAGDPVDHLHPELTFLVDTDGQP